MPRRGEDADTSGEGTSWIVLRHTPAEGLGLLANALRDYGVHHRVLDVPRGDALPKDIRGVGGVIVLGGPMAVYESDRYPFLQAEITQDGQDDPLLVGVADTLTVFHLHGDTYELPPDATHLARSPHYEQQAFRWGDTVYGFQFHLEFTEPIVSRLVSDPDSHSYIVEAGIDPKALLAET